MHLFHCSCAYDNIFITFSRQLYQAGHDSSHAKNLLSSAEKIVWWSRELPSSLKMNTDFSSFLIVSDQTQQVTLDDEIIFNAIFITLKLFVMYSAVSSSVIKMCHLRSLIRNNQEY